MKKVFGTLLIIGLILISGCKGKTNHEIKNDATDKNIITTVTSDEKLNQSEPLKNNNQVFSIKNLDSLTKALLESNVKEIVEISADNSIIKSGISDCYVVKIKDSENSIYYVIVTGYGDHGNIYTNKEWETLLKNAKILDKTFEFLTDDYADEYLAIDLADAKVDKIKEITLLKETFTSYSSNKVAKIKDTKGDVYYLNFGESGISADVYTSAEWEQIKENVKILKNEQNLNDYVYSFDNMAVDLFEAGVKKIKSLNIETAKDDGYIYLKINDSGNKNYVVVLHNKSYPSSQKIVFTEDEFKLLLNHKKVLSKKFGYDKLDLYSVSAIFVSVGINEIESIKLVEDEEKEHTKEIILTDTTGKKYYVSFFDRTITSITENDENGNILYYQIVDDLSLPYGINAKDFLGNPLG